MTLTVMAVVVVVVVEEEIDSEDSLEIESDMIYKSSQYQNRAYQIVDKHHKSKERMMMIQRKDLVKLLGKGGRFWRNL
jgi:UDP-N-acetylmuramyl tripeptide synthase